MRKMLLSFKPEWHKRIMTGEKTYEYRTNFPDEEILAYMYVSAPVKQIMGIVHLGRRISLSEWKSKYKDNKLVNERISEFMKKRKYVMPILSYQHTNGVDLAKIRNEFPEFVAPQMYFYLDTREEILNYIQNNLKLTGDLITNCFDNVDDEDICRKKYREE